MDEKTLAEFMWESRQTIHDNYPLCGPLDEQSAEVRDWLLAEARAVLAFLSANKP